MIRTTLLLILAATAFAQDYAIKMTRQTEVGRASEMAITSEKQLSMKLSAEGKVIEEREETMVIVFEGTITVLAVDKLKREESYKVKVAKLTEQSGDAEAEDIFAAGTEFVVRRGEDGEPEYLVDDKPVAEGVARTLKDVFDLPSVNSTSDDIFGTKERRKVGDTWPLNSAAAAADFKARGLEVDVEKLAGTVKLEEAVEVDGHTYFRIDCRSKMTDVKIPMPPEMKLEKAVIDASFTGLMPQDPTRLRLDDKVTIVMNCTAKGKPDPNAGEMVLEMKMVANQVTRPKDK